MNTKLVAVIGLVAVGAAGVIAWRHQRAKPHHVHADTTTVHARGIDQTDTAASIIAMLRAPEAATPCETTYAALEAEQATVRMRGGKSLFKWVAPKSEFLARCLTLSDEQQRCLMPRYARDHEQDCATSSPPSDVAAKLFVFVKAEEPSYEYPH
jgi:hypothetical protein